MEYSPPPLFKQGASARAKVIVFAMAAIALLVVDARFRTLGMVRQAVGVVLYPLQVAALLPRDAVYAVGGYFSSLSSLQKENSNLKRQQLANAQMLQQGQLLLAENAQLRKLLAAAERLPVKSVMSEILYDTRDAFTRKIVLDRGSRHGIALGQPVIDDIGVVGQVTRVFPFTSEVTLLTDKNHAISVQVLRSGVRSVAYGKGQSGVLDLRFMAANADIRKGDVLVTSGIDGVYPAGLSVATVQQVEHKSSDAFAHIICQPSAGIDRNRQLLILMPDLKFPPPPPEEAADKKDKAKKRPAAKDAKDGDKSGKQEPEAKSDKPGAAASDKPAAKNAAPAKAEPVAAKPAAPVAGKPQQAADAKAAAPKLEFPIAPKPAPATATPMQTAAGRPQAAPQTGQAAPKPAADSVNKKKEDAR
jgi:rod shape-determining protein MreC